MFDDISSIEYISIYDLTQKDKECIRRLQALRKTGAVNMATELQYGLVEVFGEEKGMETYKWVENNPSVYMSGKWTEMDVSG